MLYCNPEASLLQVPKKRAEPFSSPFSSPFLSYPGQSVFVNNSRHQKRRLRTADHTVRKRLWGDVFYGLLLKSGKAPRKVFDNIINMFGTDGETDGIRADSLFQKFLFRKLGMGRGGRMDHQALHVRHIGKQ